MKFLLSPSLGDQLTPSPTLLINERVRRMWAAGDTVYHLGFGESRFPVHPKIARALAENGARRSYLPGKGLPELRQAIAEFHTRQLQHDVSGDQVIVAPGSKALLFALQMALEGATILHTPSWVSYAAQARLVNRPTLRIPANPQDGHRLDPASLKKLLRESEHDQHLLILNSPNNPTGQMLEPALLAEALLFALQIALEGATILHTPSWVSYAAQARLVNRPTLRIPANPQDGHRLDPASLKKLLRESEHDQHLLILNSPNNPTGQMLEPALLAEIAAICRQENVLVLSDEIYALTAFGGDHVSISRYYPEGTVVLGGMSKHLSLGGWRMGTAIVPPAESGQQLLQAVAKVGSELWSSASAPIQYAALTAYSGDPELAAYIQKCTRLHAARTRFLWRGLCELDVPCAEPMGGFYLFPNFDHWRRPLAAKGVRTSNDLARFLLDTMQIATLPGTDFGAPGQELSLRLSTSYVDLETDAKATRMVELADGSISEERLLQDYHPGMNEVLHRFQTLLASL